MRVFRQKWWISVHREEFDIWFYGDLLYTHTHSHTGRMPKSHQTDEDLVWKLKRELPRPKLVIAWSALGIRAPFDVVWLWSLVFVLRLNGQFKAGRCWNNITVDLDLVFLFSTPLVHFHLTAWKRFVQLSREINLIREALDDSSTRSNHDIFIMFVYRLPCIFLKKEEEQISKHFPVASHAVTRYHLLIFTVPPKHTKSHLKRRWKEKSNSFIIDYRNGEKCPIDKEKGTMEQIEKV